jgi:endonuclease/exonuclease/phosphatase (EEP) superfamily protein YafD
MTRTKQLLLLLPSVVLVASCSRMGTGLVEPANDYEEFQGLQLAPLRSVDECKQSLALIKPGVVDDFDSANIQILNWNIKKGEESDWGQDLDRFATGKQLILLQEAALSMGLSGHLHKAPFAAFSPGYIRDDDITGVVTFSTVKPLSHCRLGAIEPWLGTPKSTNITQYALSNTDQNLVVVNIHSVNFSFGLVSYRAQLNAVVEVLSDHQGPVIFSGDFNTWRQGRQDALMQSVDELGLHAVQFSEDRRRTTFGRPLDHVFVGGLNIAEADVYEVNSSDHNPIVVSLSLTQSRSSSASSDI